MEILQVLDSSHRVLFYSLNTVVVGKSIQLDTDSSTRKHKSRPDAETILPREKGHRFALGLSDGTGEKRALFHGAAQDFRSLTFDM